VDKKTNIADFDEYKNDMFFIKQRVDVRWGGYSQIECMLVLLNEARKGEYDYICLLSGDDLPLKNSNEIKEIFEKNSEKEFIGIEKRFDRIEQQLKDRLRYKQNKYYKMLPPLYKGPNWFCITKKLTDYIFEYLENNEWYKEAFKDSLCGDEEFFQTIVMNSEYKDKIYNYEIECDDNRMALRYIDWGNGLAHPRVLTESDLRYIKNTNCIFGRKFSENIDIDKYKRELNIE
jgi:Core-2/I-Branching enzyme.